MDALFPYHRKKTTFITLKKKKKCKNIVDKYTFNLPPNLRLNEQYITNYKDIGDVITERFCKY